jgi:membrane fusion protein (multidrug efflux system)
MSNNKLINLLLILVPSIVLSSCHKQVRQGQATGPVTIVDYVVRSQIVSFYETYPGTVTSLNEVELHSQVSGFITGIYFTEGSHVNKGEKLYEIDRRKYQAAWEQARANSDIAEANLQKALRDAERYTKLNEQNAIAKQTFDDAATSLQNSKMQVVSAKAALLNAETDFSYSIIKAPFSGIIGLSSVKTGTFINQGQTLLNTLSSVDPIGVDFIINEKSLSAFVDLKKEEAGKADSTFRIVLPDNTGYPFSGTLSVIDRAVNPFTGTIKIRLTFPNHNGILRPGMNCKVKVLDKNSGSQVVIPYKAVIEQMGEYFVYSIDSSKAKQVKIEPGPNLGEYIVVKRGVSEGDRIVLDGLQKIHNGSLVQTGNPAEKQGTVMR